MIKSDLPPFNPDLQQYRSCWGLPQLQRVRVWGGAPRDCVGLGPDDIDAVVCSHMHIDHCGCNVFSNKSTIFVHARELEAAKLPDAADSGYIAADWDHPLKMQVIDKKIDVFGDGRITLVPLPGHSRGMTGALVTLDRCEYCWPLMRSAYALISTTTPHPKTTRTANTF